VQAPTLLTSVARRTLTLMTALAWIALAAAMYAVFFAGRRDGAVS
jgi:hypothetical protein